MRGMFYFRPEGTPVTGVRWRTEGWYMDGYMEGSMQTLSKDGTPVETRTSPPWFTEQEMRQLVEGVEE